jgi:hypothetical protein
MHVSEILTFNEYWSDPRFFRKRPRINGSRKQQFGDNIYHRDGNGAWRQADSHHSYPDGTVNPANVASDTRIDRVLIAQRFTYWGGSGPEMPECLRTSAELDVVCPGVGHRCCFADETLRGVLDWLDPLMGEGFVGRPASWPSPGV